MNEAQQLTREQCLCRLASHRVGRVSVSRGALPVIMPVTYVHDGDSVLFRAPLDAGFIEACDRSVIAFEVGGVDCDDGEWSVHVVGIASMVTADTARVDLERVSGRQLGSVSMLHGTPLITALPT
jgi:nitroimidazol reductase NimA-like FMN-containing flavoprotein (pyridoxamine 5'-phosphate oxidase superfamily)